MSDEREGAFRSVFNETRDQTADVADQVKSAAEDLYGQASSCGFRIPDGSVRG